MTLADIQDGTKVKAALEKLPSISFEVQVDVETPGGPVVVLVITSAAPQGKALFAKAGVCVFFYSIAVRIWNLWLPL